MDLLLSVIVNISFISLLELITSSDLQLHIPNLTNFVTNIIVDLFFLLYYSLICYVFHLTLCFILSNFLMK